MDKREIVEAWLSRLCTQLDLAVLDDHEFWATALVVDESGQKHVVLRRRLRLNEGK